MIDHDTARRGLATEIDFPLDPREREAIDDHLRSCSSCRAFDAGLRADAASLRDIDFGPVPVAVRANVAIAAEQRRRAGGAGRLLLLAGVGALLVAALGAGVLGVGGQGTTGLGSNRGTEAVDWHTEVVDFQAQEFWIDANGRRFTAQVPGPVQVRSDPGNATYRTLEATWFEGGVEMRLNLYFGGDAASWWVDEIRVYDAKAAPDTNWVEWEGRWFQTPLGGTWAGDLDLQAAEATVHVGGLLLRSTPFDAVNEPILGGKPLPHNARPFEAGGAFSCSGILQMAPRDAEAALLGLGYKLSWRLVTTTGPNTGFAQPMETAPDGIINQEPAVGTSGELVMFVAPFGDPGANPVPYPAECGDPPTPSDPIVLPRPTTPVP